MRYYLTQICNYYWLVLLIGKNYKFAKKVLHSLPEKALETSKYIQNIQKY